jgi:hypothetical protein
VSPLSSVSPQSSVSAVVPGSSVPRRRTLLSVSLLLAGVASAACAPEVRACPTENPPTGLAIAAANRTNAAKPAWPAELDAELDKITSAVEGGATNVGVTVVRADGAPGIGCVLVYEPSTGSDHAKEYYRDQFKQVVRAEATADVILSSSASSSAGQAGLAALVRLAAAMARPGPSC